MEAKFTPGPWCISGKTGAGLRIFVESDLKKDNWDCCRVEVISDDCNYEMAEANARLIAAAPDLYAACEAVHAMLSGRWPDDSPIIVQLRSALALARGEKP